jgi:hypothetical protein
VKNYWVSWYCPPDKMGKFELYSPWWVSGMRMHDDAETICAAVQAKNEDQAKLKIIMSHDADCVAWASNEIEWRFVSEKPANWSPFCDRFPKADWMQWPQAAV